jgi:proline iminopeptidase
VHGAAADEWCRWEAAIEPRAPDFFDEAPADRLAQARIVTHYWAHGSWLDEGEIIANAARLAGIPGVLVQGTLDLGNLLGTPWQLASVWPDAELRLVDAGHEMRSEAMVDALVQALDSFGSAA